MLQGCSTRSVQSRVEMAYHGGQTERPRGSARGHRDHLGSGPEASIEASVKCVTKDRAGTLEHMLGFVQLQIDAACLEGT